MLYYECKLTSEETEMKQVIGNKTYNTETATVLAIYENGSNINDFTYCAETLMRTPKGNLMIHGEGGAMSIYATHSGNNSSWGESIIAIDDDEMYTWLEERNPTIKIEGILPEEA